MAKNNKEYAREIATLILERMAARKNNTLPLRFWTNPLYAKDFKLQIVLASSFLRRYSGEAILNALKSGKGKNIWSLGAKWLEQIIAEEEQKLKKIQISKDQTIEHKPELPVAPVRNEAVPIPKKKSHLSKLDD